MERPLLAIWAHWGALLVLTAPPGDGLPAPQAFVVDSDKGTLNGQSSGVLQGAPFSIDAAGRETIVAFYQPIELAKGSTIRVVGSKPAVILLKDLSDAGATLAASKGSTALAGRTGVLQQPTTLEKATQAAKPSAPLDVSDFLEPDSMAILSSLTELAKDPQSPTVIVARDFYSSVMDLFADPKVANDESPNRRNAPIVVVPEPESGIVWSSLFFGVGLLVWRRRRRTAAAGGVRKELRPTIAPS
jgi:hypothetical protein